MKPFKYVPLHSIFHLTCSKVRIDNINLLQLLLLLDFLFIYHILFSSSAVIYLNLPQSLCITDAGKLESIYDGTISIYPKRVSVE